MALRERGPSSGPVAASRKKTPALQSVWRPGLSLLGLALPGHDRRASFRPEDRPLHVATAAAGRIEIDGALDLRGIETVRRALAGQRAAPAARALPVDLEITVDRPADGRAGAEQVDGEGPRDRAAVLRQR